MRRPGCRVGRRSCLGLLGVLVLAGVGSPALGQQALTGLGVVPDSDPANNTVSTPDLVLLGRGNTSSFGVCRLVSGADVDYYGVFFDSAFAGGVSAFMTTPLGGYPGSLQTPDTLLQSRNIPDALLASSDDAGSDYAGGVVVAARGSLVRVMNPQVTVWVTYFRVQSLGGASAGPYGVTASISGGETSYAPFREIEPNDTPATATRLNQRTLDNMLIGAELGSSGIDQDWYAVPLGRGDVLAAFTTPMANIPANLQRPDTIVDVFAPDGATTLVTDDDAGTDIIYNYNTSAVTSLTARGSAVRLVAPAAGTYFLRVRGFNAAATGSYTLTLSRFPANLCPADVDGNGAIGANDLTILLNSFGQTCP
ncbi:MAG: hypothetical protein IBJ11_10645 [Phycisphaerales bacterium]|nr:hypothetical protein [Phycisphaerales bacterium]